MNKRAISEMCIIIVLKDLSAVYYASFPKYNKNFLDFLRISELARYS